MVAETLNLDPSVFPRTDQTSSGLIGFGFRDFAQRDDFN